MLIATDVDGTIDADPVVFQFLLAAARQAGAQVAVLTGIHGASQITPSDCETKRAYLAQLGFTAYDTLVVFPDNGNLPQAKAQWCQAHGADVLIDNNRANAQASTDACLVLVPWATRMGKVKNGR
jgi:hypothetical protein